jgi:L-proline amide hydrolase
VSTEGTIPYAGGETWYRIVGDGEEPGKLPLVCLHGGPGALHDYLEPLGELAATGRRVLFYDQIGCGRSWTESKPPDFWTVDLFVSEVQAVRAALGLAHIHLFGSSWGGMLAMEYALTKPSGLASLVLSSSPASIPVWEAETGRLKRELPVDVQAILDEHEAAGTLDSPEYQSAQMAFYARHVCRVPYPDCVLRTFAGVAEHPDVYMTMQGPNEFVITGTLKHWDISDRLGEIDVPTLITAGAYDEFTPVQAEALHAGIAGSELVTFEDASHMQFVEEPERYRELVAEFLERVERE